MRRHDRRRRVRPMSLMLCGAAVVSLALVFERPAGGQNGAPPPSGQPPLQQAAVRGPLDEPLALLSEGRRKFSEVRDYTCTLQSQERVRGVLLDENVMLLKMRTEPFSVYMRWLAPAKSRNQEVCFVLGRNNNKMRVHSTVVGKGKFLGFVSVDPTDPRVTEHSRHTIYEAGLGNLIEQTIKHWEMENKLGKTQVKIEEYTYNNRRAIRIETKRAERLQSFYCYRSILYVDAETKLPLRTENYDWPRPGGPPEGDLLEMFSYIDLRLNVGLTDQDFNK
jgi:Protein of unknown function (DUF1571)